MDNVEEALSMWKTFKEAILSLTNLKNIENNMKRLTNVIKSDEFLKMLIPNHNPNLTLEQSNAINEKYKSFTMWVLGRFFYLLGHCKLHR